jgi:hypothetical protein
MSFCLVGQEIKRTRLFEQTDMCNHDSTPIISVGVESQGLEPPVTLQFREARKDWN